ncbi:unnamed protein product [Prorocentrum cordatum]|uniref:Uncharacterized protein n=1 Tax=Prorocentrum cordatum TaxID=2364126 RepID=A0ABN9UUE5_9DINO|nr:unnamed protein product [Polarella glacialis]
MHGSIYEDRPVEEPRAMLWMAKNIERTGGSPMQWYHKYLTENRIALCRLLEHAGCGDQLNFASLAAFEVLARRAQRLLDAASRGPVEGRFEGEELRSGHRQQRTAGIAPAPKAHVTNRTKGNADIEKQRQRAREVRAAAANPGAKPDAERRVSLRGAAPSGAFLALGVTFVVVLSYLIFFTMQSELFPLPSLVEEGPCRAGLSRGVRQRVARRHAVFHRANDAIDALNWLSGCGEKAPPVGACSRAQFEAARHVRSVMQRSQAIDIAPRPDEAARALLRPRAGYDSDEHIVSDCQEELLSVPSSCKDCPRAVGVAPAEAASMQVDFFFNRLESIGVLRWCATCNGRAAVFCAKKKSGNQRLVVGARRINRRFRDPPGVGLATAESLGLVEVDDDAEISVSAGDVRGASYRFKVDVELSRYFALPPPRAEELGVREAEGEWLSPDRWVHPCVAVLTMGFKWSLYLVQEAVAKQVETAAGVPADRRLQTFGGSRLITSGGQLPHYVYVGNVGFLGSQRKEVQTLKDQARGALDGVGLATREHARAQTSVGILGVAIDGRVGMVATALENMWNIDRLLTRLLDRGAASGHQPESTVDRLAFIFMLRRPLLSVLSATYQFMRGVGGGQVDLWPSVRAEHSAAPALLPFAFAQWKLPWHREVVATGACPTGRGVVESIWGEKNVKEVGMVDERLRFRVRQDMAHRAHALAGSRDALEDGCAIYAPKGTNDPDEAPWKYVYSGSYFTREGPVRILEAKGMIWALRRCEVRRLASDGRRAREKLTTPRPARQRPVARLPRGEPAAQPAETRRRTATLIRQDRFSVEAAFLGHSLLEAKAVGEKVHKRCLGLMEEFARGCARLGPSLNSPEEIDFAPIEVFDERFFNGTDGGVGHFRLAAIKGLRREFGRAGMFWLSRARPAWAAAMVELARASFLATAIEMLVALVTYGRPGGIHQLKAKWLIPPLATVGPHWAIVIRPPKELRPTNVGIYDNTVVWNREGARIIQLLVDLKRGKEDRDPQSGYRCASCLKQVKTARKRLGLTKLVPYRLRHSGASWDCLPLRRTFDEVMKRGQRGSHKSVVQWQRPPKSFKLVAMWCVANLCRALLDGPPAPAAPSLPRSGILRASTPAVAASRLK